MFELFLIGTATLQQPLSCWSHRREEQDPNNFRKRQRQFIVFQQYSADSGWRNEESRGVEGQCWGRDTHERPLLLLCRPSRHRCSTPKVFLQSKWKGEVWKWSPMRSWECFTPLITSGFELKTPLDSSMDFFFKNYVNWECCEELLLSFKKKVQLQQIKKIIYSNERY